MKLQYSKMFLKHLNLLVVMSRILSGVALIPIILVNISPVLAVNTIQKTELSQQQLNEKKKAKNTLLIAGFLDDVKDAVEDVDQTINGSEEAEDDTTDSDVTDTIGDGEVVVYSFSNYSPANNEVVANGSFTVKDNGDGVFTCASELIDYNITVNNTQTGKKTLITPSTVLPNNEGFKCTLADVTISPTVLDFSTATNGMLYLETGDEYNDFYLRTEQSHKGKNYRQTVGTGDNVSTSNEPFSLKAIAQVK